MLEFAEFEPRRRLVLSMAHAAEALDCNIYTIKRMVERGELERVQISPRRVGITTRSIMKLIDKGASA